MSVEISFIQLTAYNENPSEGVSGPYFKSDLWPILLSNAEVVTRVYLVAHSGWDVNHKAVVTVTKVSEHVADVGPLKDFSRRQLDEICSMSWFGHLNVFYEMRADCDVVKDLIQSYPRPGTLSNSQMDTLGIQESDRKELAILVSSVPPSRVLVSFSHDGDPLYIFGELSTLKTLLDLTQ